MATPEQTYLDIVTELEFLCSDAPNPVIQRTVVRAMRKIAKDTCLLETTLKPQVQDYVAEYDFESLLPQGFCVGQINRVKYCDSCIDPIDPCACDPCGFEVINRGCIRLHPTPCGVEMDALEVTVSVMPEYDLCTIPAELVKEQELIQMLASAELLAMPKKAWTDARQAAAIRRQAQAQLVTLSREVAGNYAPHDVHDYRSQAL